MKHKKVYPVPSKKEAMCAERKKSRSEDSVHTHTHPPLRGGRRKETVIYDFRKQKDFPESTSEESVLLGKKIIRQ